MYIVSKFKDYYDGVTGTIGIDKSIIYERHSTGVVLPNSTPTPNSVNGWMSKYYMPTLDMGSHKHTAYKKLEDEPDYCDFFFIGFCGKLYVGYYFRWNKKDLLNCGQEYTELFTYDFDKIVELIDLKNKRPNKLIFHAIKEKDRVASFKTSWNHYNGMDVRKLSIELKCPVWIIFRDRTIIPKAWSDKFETTSLLLNPPLKDYCFAKAVEPYMAVQELSMFIGGSLTNPENNMVVIDEKYRMAAHGIDKTSFRQIAPGQKKEKRRSNKEHKREQNRHS